MTVLKAQCLVPRRIQLKINSGDIEDVSITKMGTDQGSVSGEEDSI